MAIFDASKIPPQQGGGKHPVGNKFPFTITNTEKKPVANSNNKFLFAVTLTSPVGSITNNYNMWNDSAQAVDIAAKQLSALCHAVGIFQVDIENGGKQLIGGQGLMDIDFQAGQGPTAEKPEGGYVEVKKVYDKNGNEPGKAPTQQNAPTGAWGGQQQPQQQQAPQTAQQQQPAQQQPQVQQGWQNQPSQQQAPNPAAATWNQAAPAETPPWGR